MPSVYMKIDFVNAEAIGKVRHFNRFYTRHIGVLNEHLANSGFSLAEARVLYELANAPARPQEIAARLGLDAGYLSRILKRFATQKLIKRQADETDRRRVNLMLTRTGNLAFSDLDRRAAQAAGGFLSTVSPASAARILEAMQTIETNLNAKAGAAAPIELRGLRIGDVGWIAHRQGLLYSQEYGWDHTYEALVAKILADFVLKFDPLRENCWVAERDGQVLGSVFLVRETGNIARLRLLYVEPGARGSGLGRELVQQCTAFARQTSYARIVLWTQSILSEARRIYLKEGYVLVKSEQHRSFGCDLEGETWELAL